MVNRKLIRPNLAEIKEKLASSQTSVATTTLAPEPVTREIVADAPVARRRPAPPELTSAEAFYYLKQMNSKTAMVVVMDNGEVLRGHIEWYDRSCLKVNREGEPNLLVYKHAIRYMYKRDEEGGGSPKE